MNHTAPRHVVLWVSCLGVLLPVGTLRAQAPALMPLSAARAVLQSDVSSLPPALRAPGLDAPAWNRWASEEDRSIRDRVLQGEELTLANLLRLGVTYTTERRIDFTLLDQYGQKADVTGAVERRARDLIAALGTSHAEGMLMVRAFLEQKGYGLDSAAARDKADRYLLAVVARQRDDVRTEQARAHVDPSDVFRDRGLSTDSDVYTGYALDLTLQELIRRGLLRLGGVHRVGVIGPGLDFVNKKGGYDFYPPQVLQPYLLIDSLARLGLADADAVRLFTYDVSAQVNDHIVHAGEAAARGTPYPIQLLWNWSTSGSGEFQRGFMAYWDRCGDHIGNPIEPLAIPPSARADLRSRAVSVRPDIVGRVTPVDMDVIVQTQPLAPADRLDLIVGTNIFLYYDTLRQELALVNMAGMLKPGGLLVSNTPLPVFAPAGLEFAVRNQIALGPGVSDDVYAYRRRP